MARARNIKPGFFKNEVLGTADPFVSLLFAGLWTLADRAGILEDRPMRIKAELFPYRENFDINGYLTVLVSLGFIHRYKVDGMSLIQVKNFSKHQNPHHTERKSDLPGYSEGCEITVIEPLNNGSPPSDSLIPDSLNTDSLIPDSLLQNAAHSVLSQARQPVDKSVDNFDEDDDGPCNSRSNGIPYQKIVDLYHVCLPNNRHCRELTEKRKGQIRALWRSGALPDLETWEKYFQACAKSKFLTGQVEPQPGHERFSADIEWLTKQSNYVKILEGKYRG